MAVNKKLRFRFSVVAPLALLCCFTLLFASCGLKKPPKPIAIHKKGGEPLKEPKVGGYELAD